MAKDDDGIFDFHGIPIKIAPMDDCEKATYLVCTTADTPSPWSDNLRGVCGVCGVAIQYRPYMPKEPMKICIDCFQKTLQPH